VAYEGLYNESLLDRLHSELSGDFRVIPRFRASIDSDSLDCRPDLTDSSCLLAGTAALLLVLAERDDAVDGGPGGA